MVPLSIGILIGVASFTFDHAEGASYLSNDPRSCVNCHVMRDVYDGWTRSSHHAVAVCNDCHTPRDFFGKWYTKAENGFWHSTKFTLQNWHEPIRIRESNSRVLQNNCLYCHQDFVHDTLRPDSEGQASLSCVTCHIQVGHGPAKP